jgi:hypothetical protein
MLEAPKLPDITDLQQRAYGKCLEDGCGVQKDILEALRYYELAIASSNPSAQDDVNRCQRLLRGTAVESCRSRSLSW